MELKIAVCDDNMLALDSEADAVADVLRIKGIESIIEKFNDPELLISSDSLYDIVFLDIEMEQIDGIEAARALRERNNNCLIFFVTNHEGYLDKALNQHAFRFWKKPIDKDKLMYGIESAVREIKKQRCQRVRS